MGTWGMDGRIGFVPNPQQQPTWRIKMPRTKNLGNYPAEFHEIPKICALGPGFEVDYPAREKEGEDGKMVDMAKKEAELQRFTWYGFVKALERVEELADRRGVETIYMDAVAVQVLLRKSDSGWKLIFRSRDNDPFWNGMREAVAEAKKRVAPELEEIKEEKERAEEEEKLEPHADPLASYGPQEGETEAEWYERIKN